MQGVFKLGDEIGIDGGYAHGLVIPSRISAYFAGGIGSIFYDQPNAYVSIGIAVFNVFLVVIPIASVQPIAGKICSLLIAYVRIGSIKAGLQHADLCADWC